MVDEEWLSGSRDRGVRRICDASFAPVSDRTSDRLRQRVITGDWRVVLQGVNDQAFIDRLLHPVRMEWPMLCLPFRTRESITEPFQRSVLWCCCEREEACVGPILRAAIRFSSASLIVSSGSLIASFTAAAIPRQESLAHQPVCESSSKTDLVYRRGLPKPCSCFRSREPNPSVSDCFDPSGSEWLQSVQANQQGASRLQSFRSAATKAQAHHLRMFPALQQIVPQLAQVHADDNIQKDRFESKVATDA